MRLLLDNNLSSKLVEPLVTAGHDVAVKTRRVLVSADSDFGTLLARTNATSPSFVLVRRLIGRRVPELAAVLIENLPLVEDDLEAGAVVVLGDAKLRIRRLPIL